MALVDETGDRFSFFKKSLSSKMHIIGTLLHTSHNGEPSWRHDDSFFIPSTDVH